ncbi:MAG: NusG domain II-containing protein [bacterium]
MDKKLLKPRAFDLLPILIIVALAIIPLLPKRGETSSFIIITPDEKIVLPAEVDTSIAVESAVGPMEIGISDGKAHVERASCPNKICVSMGEIHNPGSSLICAPGRTAVICIGEEEFDAVTR